jgi:hypothetical protein
MAAHVAVGNLAATGVDGALVAPEAYVTKPNVRSCLRPTGVDAEGLCAVPMLLPDIELCP